MVTPLDLIDVNGFKWPRSDTECRRVVFDTTRDMHGAIARCRGFGLALQAGGNCGVWPAHLARIFERVVTFEPDEINYACLEQNVPGNVEHHRAALGDTTAAVDLRRIPGNIGAHTIVEGRGDIPVVTIDSLDLAACDYLCLDIEGYEMKALKGAQATIAKHHPVIQIEDKGLSREFGYDQGAAEAWLGAEFGYQVVQRIHRDVILA